MTTEKKIAEALDHVQQAQKCLKTSFLKWSPDLDGAASEYIKAATCYKNAKSLSEARDMYVKAAEIQMKMNAAFHAAKSFEQAGLISKEAKEMELAVQFMERAAHMFQEDGTPSTAAICLEKAGKMVEQTHPAKAVELYKKASEVAEIEDRPRQSAENTGRAGRLLIRLQRYDEAIALLQKEIAFYAEAENYAQIAKVVLGVVMLKLTLGDFVAADSFYRSSISYPQFGDSEEAMAVEQLLQAYDDFSATHYPQFGDSEEAMAVEQLLQAYDDGDEEEARRVLALPLIKYMDNVFAKLARDMVIPGGMATGRRAEGGATAGGGDQMGGASSEGGAAGGGGGAPTQLDDDELEGGLC